MQITKCCKAVQFQVRILRSGTRKGTENEVWKLEYQAKKGRKEKKQVPTQDVSVSVQGLINASLTNNFILFLRLLFYSFFHVVISGVTERKIRDGSLIFVVSLGSLGRCILLILLRFFSRLSLTDCGILYAQSIFSFSMMGNFSHYSYPV